MTRKNLFAAVVVAASALASSAAFAGGEFDPLRDYQEFQGGTTKSTLTRAEVKAQTAAAIKDGSINDVAEMYGYAQPQKVTSTVTRAEVKAEAQAALKASQRNGRRVFDGS